MAILGHMISSGVMMGCEMCNATTILWWLQRGVVQLKHMRLMLCFIAYYLQAIVFDDTHTYTYIHIYIYM